MKTQSNFLFLSIGMISAALAGCSPVPMSSPRTSGDMPASSSRKNSVTQSSPQSNADSSPSLEGDWVCASLDCVYSELYISRKDGSVTLTRAVDGQQAIYSADFAAKHLHIDAKDPSRLKLDGVSDRFVREPSPAPSASAGAQAQPEARSDSEAATGQGL